jgi:HlyD family secretion protein
MTGKADMGWNAWRWIKWGAGAVLFFAILYVAFAPERVLVEARPVTRGPFEVSVTAEGRTRIRDIFTVSAPVAGRLRRVTLDPGDPVTAGETTVAIFEPAAPEFLDRRATARSRARLEQAKAATARARADLDLARIEWERARSLPVGTTISGRERDHRLAEFQMAEAAHQAAKAEQAVAQAELIVPTDGAGDDAGAGCCLRMATPVNGRVLRVLQESERVMPAGTAILELGDPRDLEVVVDLLSQDAVRVRRGQPVRIENWGGDGILNGRVRYVEPSGFTKISALGVEEQRVNVVIDLTDPQPRREALLDAYRVEPRIVVWSMPEVVSVPIGALFRSGPDWAVYTIEGKRARLRRVNIGERNGEAAQVLKGLKPGDLVIAHPSEDVADEVRVRQAREY